MASPTFTLRTVTPAGALDKFLPSFESLTLSPMFCKPGTVTINYPITGKNFFLLKDNTEIAILNNGVEISELRCIIESTEGDDVEDSSVWTFTARTLLGLLDRAVVYPKNWPSRNPPNHEFVDATIGMVLIELLQRAQTRGTLPEITWDFTAAEDSAGNPWVDNSIDVVFEAGIKYSEVLSNMVETGWTEVRMTGRMLQVYNRDTLGSDKSTGINPLKFLRGRDIHDSPRKSTVRDLATVALVSAEIGPYLERVSDGATMSLWGRRESYSSFSGWRSTLALGAIGDWMLETTNRPLTEITHGLILSDDDNPTPIVDFNVGDWGLTDVGRGWEKYRIKQWVGTVDKSGSITGSVVLNDLIEERVQKLSRRLDALSNGTSGVAGSDEKDDGKAPAAPGGVELSSDYYIQDGRARTLLTIEWSPVTTNFDGTDMDDLAGYRCRWRYTGASFWRATTGVDSNELVAFFDNVNPNSSVQVQVQAFDKYNHFGDWSTAVTGSTAVDLAAPAKTSIPVVTSNVGTLRVFWDGKDFAAQPMAADLAGVEVHIGPSGVFVPDSTTLKDFLGAAAPTAVTITGLSYGTEYWARLVAVDTSGNRSPASDENATSHATLQQLVNVEIGTGQVGLSNIRFSDVGNLVEDGSFENASLRVARQAQMVGTHMSFDNTVASNGTWSFKVTGQNPWSPTEEIILQQGLPVKPGERLFGAADYRASVDSDASSTISLGVRWYDKTGILLNTGGLPGTITDAFYTLATNYNVVPRDGNWSSRVSFSSRLAPTNAVTCNIVIRIMTHFAGTVWVDGVEVRKQIDTLLIQDAAITSAKIGSLQVNDAHMANVSIGKLTVGNLTADMTVSSRIKTASTGQRAEMSASGFEAYNSGGVRTFQASSAGLVTLIGELRSGTSGNRVEINPGATGLPEIRLYPASGSNFGYLNAVSFDSTVSVGLNSGSFTVGGESVYNRLYMGSDFMRLQVVKTDQSSWGGFVSVQSGQVTIGRSGFGLNDSTLSFNDDGKMRFLGEVGYWADPSNGLIMGGEAFTGGPYGGGGSLYGATMASIPQVLAILYDNNTSNATGIGVNLVGRTTSGFDLSFSKNMAGSDGAIYFWAWRT